MKYPATSSPYGAKQFWWRAGNRTEKLSLKNFTANQSIGLEISLDLCVTSPNQSQNRGL